MNFPFIAGNTTTVNKETELTLFTEYAWDFEKDCFIYKNGKNVLVTGKEALKVWIYKTLKTERYRYLAYHDSYGAELEQFQGKAPNNEESAMEVERYVTEALLVNPYITGLENIEFTSESNVLEFAVTVNTVYGQVNF